MSRLTELATLRRELECLNESIYEPEQLMQASERDRRMLERDRVYERIVEIEEAMEEERAAEDSPPLDDSGVREALVDDEPVGHHRDTRES